MLDADLRLRLGALELDLRLTAAAGEVVALLGPNGAGKSTAVRALAGLRPLDSGRISLHGEVLDEPATGVFVPAERRPVGVVFQDHLLFPRMSALDNVAFGLQARGASRRDARRQALGWLERLGLAAHAGARPAALSGGQAQRVALARALATEPRLLLLDEPLAALDATARLHVRAELRRHLATFDGVRLLVTHDPIDALVLADRLVIVEHGRVTQRGAPSEVTARPASRYVADLVGINLLQGAVAEGPAVQLQTGGRLVVAGSLPAPGTAVAIAVRPQAVALYPDDPRTSGPPRGSPRNTWRAVVAGVEADRDRVRVTLGGDVPLTAEVTATAAADLALRPGTPVWASLKAVDASVYER